jgi:hypothetical protein
MTAYFKLMLVPYFSLQGVFDTLELSDPLVFSFNPIPLISRESSSINKECYCELAGTFLNLHAFHYHTWSLQNAADEHYVEYVFVEKE